MNVTHDLGTLYILAMKWVYFNLCLQPLSKIIES